MKKLILLSFLGSLLLLSSYSSKALSYPSFLKPDNVLEFMKDIRKVSYEQTRNLVKAFWMKYQDCKEPSLELRAIAEEALKSAGITKDVIILEKSISDTSGKATTFYGFNILELKPLKNSNKSAINAAIFTTFHEAGHIYYEHANDTKSLLQLTGLGPLLLIMHRTILNDAFLYSFVLAVNTFFYKYTLPSYMRFHEKQADLFACNQLVKTGRTDIVIDIIAFPVGVHEDLESAGILAKRNKDHHASAPEQARYLTHCLQENGYNVTKQELYESFKRQILDKHVLDYENIELNDLLKFHIAKLLDENIEQHSSNLFLQDLTLYEYNFVRERLDLPIATSFSDIDQSWLKKEVKAYFFDLIDRLNGQGKTVQ